MRSLSCLGTGRALFGAVPRRCNTSVVAPRDDTGLASDGILKRPREGRVLESSEFHHVVAGALVADGRVLMCHRHPDRTWYPDLWDLPGGHVNAAEPPAAALARELNEELGITIEPPSTDPFAVLRPAEELEMSVWVFTSWDGHVTNQAPEEHDMIEWFTRSDLPSLRVAHRSIVDLCLSIL